METVITHSEKERTTSVHDDSYVPSSSSFSEDENKTSPAEITAFDPVEYHAKQAREEYQQYCNLSGDKRQKYEYIYATTLPFLDYQEKIMESYHRLLSIAPETSHYYESIFNLRLKGSRSAESCQSFLMFLENETKKQLDKQARMDAVLKFIEEQRERVDLALKFFDGRTLSK